MSMIIAASLILGAVTPGAPAVTSLTVVPRATDPSISEDKFNSPHSIYVNRRIIVEGAAPLDRHQLLLFLTGTGGTAQGARAFCDLAADLGYHVINLIYPDEIPATVCRND